MGKVSHKSFTLIELIVAVGVVGLILPAVFNIFFIIIRQQLVLVAYQEMKLQGDSAQKNIKNILQNRTAYITDSAYTATDVCPPITTPTPTNSPNLYIKDTEGNSIHLYPKTIVTTITTDTIASVAAEIKTYNLTSQDVTISNLAFSCYRINEFTPPIVSTNFIVHKSTIYSDISLQYTFNVRLRNY